jgi:hypothetical protein
MVSFNPRARGGRDSSVNGMANSFAVSIHAPAGGATVWLYRQIFRGSAGKILRTTAYAKQHCTRI